MVYQIRCQIVPGMFSREFGVSVRQFDGITFTLFAPRESVVTQKEPSPGTAVDGWLKVQLVKKDEKKKLILVRLPRPTVEQGRYLTVNSGDLKTIH